ncbi:MAG: alpha-amylase family glycosyl hydrolase [Bacteroidota bacterium]
MVLETNLKLIRDILKEKYLLTKPDKFNYSIATIWLRYKLKKPAKRILKINPYKFFFDAVDYIQKQKPGKMQKTKNGEWTKSAVIYNLFVRAGCAFNHSQNGKLDLPCNEEGFRETGSFMKAIALLPYIKSLGTNTVHLLPITPIGSDGNKGKLGSPYAIKNPYEIDPSLCEPNIGVGAEIEFKAFVEAAHKLGMRVVAEFVFRTSAKDGDWVKEHPEWFYWIKENIEDREPKSNDESKYGTPVFTQAELEKIFYAVGNERFDQLIPPHAIYREMFTDPPKRENIHHINNRYVGILDNGQRVRIPGAFADWPPNDTQPPWGDVTYLKLYNHPDFNYIGYNTVRMYDANLAKSENINKPLWDKIIGIIPHYQRSFGIDGVMIDMGHALPMEMKQKMIHKAREINCDFAFWDENFSVSKRSVDEGYNAVIGYVWADQHEVRRLKKLLMNFAADGYPISFFATPESHNTPRAASRIGCIEYSKYSWVINNFIPAIPFIHNGFEVGETFPINTGLGFSVEDLHTFPSHKLPLFSEFAFNWCSKNEFVDFIKNISFIRNVFKKLILNISPKTFIFHHNNHPDLVIFERKNNKRLFVVANGNPTESNKVNIDLGTKRKSATDLITGKTIQIEKGKLVYNLKPYQCVVLEL